MTRITLDTELQHILLGLTQRLELCDESGRVVARLLPVIDPDLYEGLEPQIGREEMRRPKLNKGKKFSTTEIMAHLEKL